MALPSTDETQETSPPEIKGNRSFDIEKALNLRFKRGLTLREIAAVMGYKSHRYILEKLRPYSGRVKDTVNTEAWKDHRVGLLRETQSRLISSITDRDINKAPLGSRVISFGILYDKERLETGKSTQIVDYSELHKSTESMQARLAELAAQEQALVRGDDDVYTVSTVTKSCSVMANDDSDKV